MLVRRTLQFAIVAAIAAMVLTILWNIGLGVGEPLWNTDLDAGERSPGQMVASYLRWGRWADLATVLLFAALLVVTPLLPRTRRAAHVVVAGAAVALVGDLIDLLGLANPISLRGLSPDELIAAFTIGRNFGFSTDPTSAYIWAAGVILVGIGLTILSIDAEDRRWRRVSLMLGVASVVMALTAINVFGTAQIFWLTSWIAIGTCLYWFVIALNLTTELNGSAPSPSQRTSASQ